MINTSIAYVCELIAKMLSKLPEPMEYVKASPRSGSNAYKLKRNLIRDQ